MSKSVLRMPLLHLFLQPCLSQLNCLIVPLDKLRWMLARPLRLPVLPNWVPVIPLPFVKDAPYFTYGQLFLLAPLVLLFLVGYNWTFVDPDLDESGNAASYAILVAFLTASKSNSIFLLLFGLSFERMIPIHNLSSLLALTLSFFHGYVAYAYGGDSGDSGSEDERRLSSDESEYALYGPNTNFGKFWWDGGVNTSGSLIVLCLIGLVGLSFFGFVRRYLFDLWLITHILLAMGVIVFCFVHSVTAIAFVAVWWGLDWLIRYVFMAGCRYPRRATIKKLTSDIVEIRFEKSNFRYQAGQFVQICVPAVGLQFHPVTISSAPHESDVTLHFRALGNWTRRLVDLATHGQRVDVLLEGPYGGLSINLDDDRRYPVVLCISGGIGVTPNLSIAHHLLQQRETKRLKVHFLWTVRDLVIVNALSPPVSSSFHSRPTMVDTEDATEVSASGDNQKSSSTSIVQTDIFVTKDFDEDAEALKSFNTHQGRPDLDAILESVKTEALQQGVSHIAVCVCGPKSKVEEIKRLCRKHRQPVYRCEGLAFEVHDEIFEF